MKTRYLLVGVVAVVILAAGLFVRSTLKSPNADSGVVGKWYEFYGRPGQKTWEFFEDGTSITTSSLGEQSITDYKLIDDGSRISFRSPTSYEVAKLIMDTPDAIDLDFGANDVVHLVKELPDREKTIVGRWRPEDTPSGSMEFREDGVIAAGLEGDISEVGRYELLDGNRKLKITDTTGESPSAEILSITWDGGKLILNSDEDDSTVLFQLETPDDDLER